MKLFNGMKWWEKIIVIALLINPLWDIYIYFRVKQMRHRKDG